MEERNTFRTVALSLAALLSTGCAEKTYLQTQLGYANTQHAHDLRRIDLFCVKAKGGKEIKGQEFRLGAEICHGKLPDSTSLKRYSVDVPVVGPKEADVHVATSSSLVKVTIPFLEYRYVKIGTNFSGKSAVIKWLRSPHAEDLSLGMWASGGYDIGFTISETDYSTSGGSFNNVPGIGVYGRFYGELTNETTLFGKVPLSTSVRMDRKANITPSFSGGYRIQW